MHTTKEYIKNKNKDIVSEIIEFLNEQAGTRYKANVQKTVSLISARMKDGFGLDDFKSVIIAKVSEWKDDSRMSKFIRPETLFGTKFESYLNHARKKEAKQAETVIPLYTPSQEELERYARLEGKAADSR